MISHTVKSYDKDLNKVSQSIVKMGTLVKEMIIIANDSLQNHNKSYVDIANQTDEKINKLDEEIEQKATALLALRQPMAIDLRLVIAALKMAVIMERMGDLAKNVAQRVEGIAITTDKSNLKAIQEMCKVLIDMIEDAIVAFEEHDLKKAHSVYFRDKKVNDLHHKLMDSLQKEIIANPKETLSDMQVIFAVKNFERIGDYIAKIARISHYIMTGERTII